MTERRAGLAHIPALDGIRGAGVAGILLFHAGHLRGGWLGVDLFFVLSGFLITSLLLAEFQARGRISLLGFWERRAKRLLPALFLALLGVSLYAIAIAAPEDLARIRGDSLATLLYVANWQSIFAGHDYWELFLAPSPLEHTWSLAIEEQFYLFWPPLVYFVLRRGGSSRAVAIGAGSLAGASALLMALLYDPRVDTARVYFGTDTRAFEPLLGAGLAAILRRPVNAYTDRTRRCFDVLALGSALLLGCAWVLAEGTDSRVYRGGLAGASLLAAILVAGPVVAPDGWTARLFSLRALRRLGHISYGAYLWHWALYLTLTPDRVGFEGWILSAIRIAVSLGVAELSYRLLEQPIRKGGFGGRRALSWALAAGAAVAIATVWSTQARTVATEPESALQFADGAPSILLLGDSVAQSLGPPLQISAHQRGWKTRTLGMIGCGLLRTERMRFAGGAILDLQACESRRESWDELLDEVRPRVVLIVEGWAGPGEREIDGAWSRPCEPEYDAAYRRDLANALARLGARNAIVIIATSAPPMAADLRAPPAGIPTEVLQTKLTEATDCQNRIRHEVADEAGGVVVDLASWICPDGACRREIEGVILRRDGIHFRGPGGPVVAAWLVDRIAPHVESGLR